MLTIILQTSATSQSWWHYADNNGHYLKDILSSSDRDAIGNGFAETYNPYKVEDSALHIHIPFLVNYTPALPNFGQKRFWNRVPRFPINGTPCSTLYVIYIYMFFVLWNLESNIFSRIICGYDLKCAQCLCVSSVRSLGRSQLFWLDADKKWRRMTEQIFAQDTKGRIRRGR